MDFLYQRSDWTSRCLNELEDFRGRESKISHQPFDTVGLILLALGVGGLQLMLDPGRELDWFNSTEIVVLTIIAAVGLIAPHYLGTTDDNPVVDVSLFKSRNFTVGCVSTSLCFLGIFRDGRAYPASAPTGLQLYRYHGRGLRLHQWDYCRFYLHRLSGNSAIKLICGF